MRGWLYQGLCVPPNLLSFSLGVAVLALGSSLCLSVCLQKLLCWKTFVLHYCTISRLILVSPSSVPSAESCREFGFPAMTCTMEQRKKREAKCACA